LTFYGSGSNKSGAFNHIIPFIGFEILTLYGLMQRMICKRKKKQKGYFLIDRLAKLLFGQKCFLFFGQKYFWPKIEVFGQVFGRKKVFLRKAEAVLEKQKKVASLQKYFFEKHF